MAISYDATGGQSSSAGDSATKTWTHVCAAGAILIVYAAADNSKTTNGVTYNGVAMTAIDNQTQGVQNLSAWILLNPASGSNTVEVTFSASNWNWETTRSLSYTGASAQDATAKAVSATDTVNQTITTGEANTMVIAGAAQNGGAGFNWTNLTERAEGGGVSTADDTKATAGGLSVTAFNTGNPGTMLVLVSLSPAIDNTLALAQGSFALTGFTLGMFVAHTLAMAQGAFTLTGQAVTFVLDLLWDNQSKNSTSMSNASKSSTSWANASKNSTSMTNETRHI